MANHKSAEKRVRQNEKRNAVNKSNRSKLRTEIKKLRSAVAASDKDSGNQLLGSTVSLIDKAVYDLWHWQDPRIQPQQRIEAARDRNRTYEIGRAHV